MMKDLLKKYLTEDRSVRIQTVNLSQTWQDSLKQEHHPVVRHLLGDLSAAAVLLASTLKFEGSLVLQLQGDGPISLIAVECTNQLQVRSVVKTRQERIITDTDNLQTLFNTQNRGHFIVVLDPKNRPEGQQPYQGIVPLTGNSVAEVLSTYMRQSEQVDTHLYLASNTEKATGLLLQRLPHHGGKEVESDVAEETWHRMLQLCQTIQTSEQLSIDEDSLIHRLFWDESLIAYEPQTITWQCSCSPERVANILKMLGEKEVESILAEKNEIEVNCDFCGQLYRFDAIDSAQLFLPSLSEKSDQLH